MGTSIISKYLLKNCEGLSKKVDGDKFILDGCFCKTISSLFDVVVDCGLYDQATNGEGNEKKKINAIYSSSLQSLLIFSKVSPDHPISIYGVPYTEVHFEYKNAVITEPSSIDVVLSNREGRFLFIESKLTEILDSNDSGCPEVGPGYLSNHMNGYGKLGLDLMDLKEIGIKIPDGIKQEDLYTQSRSGIKKKLGSLDEEFKKNGKLIICPIGKNKYVYSYGIKQILSHIIGIMNINEPEKDKRADGYLKTRVVLEKEKTAFLSTYNAFPKFDPEYSEEVREKLYDFKTHELEIVKILKNRKKVPFSLYEPLSYQEIYEDNLEYFGNMPEVVKFYHLDEGESC